MNFALLKETTFLFPLSLLPIIKEKKLEINEIVLLLYFWNNKEIPFDVAKIKKTIHLTEEEILNSFSILMTKQLIKLDMIKDENQKRIEVINLDFLYMAIGEKYQQVEEKNTENDIYSQFEQSLGRTLNQRDFEYIKTWLEKGNTEELILGALKQALLYHAHDLRYIDKILYDWKKKGYRTMKEVHNENEIINDSPKTEEFYDYINASDYNWLDEE